MSHLRTATPPPAREDFLDATEALLREVGMSGTGLKDVVARSGAPIGSLYHYFPGGKNQLVVEALRRHAGKSRRLLEHFFDGKASAATALRSLFDTAAEGFERAGANKGCAIGAVTLDLARSDKAIRDVCESTFEEWVAIIAPHLPFTEEHARRSFATAVVAALEGAFVVGKATRSGDAFRAAGECLASIAAANDRARTRPHFRRRRK